MQVQQAPGDVIQELHEKILVHDDPLSHVSHADMLALEIWRRQLIKRGHHQEAECAKSVALRSIGLPKRSTKGGATTMFRTPTIRGPYRNIHTMSQESVAAAGVQREAVKANDVQQLSRFVEEDGADEAC